MQYVHLIPIIPYKSRPNFQKEAIYYDHWLQQRKCSRRPNNGGYAIGAFNVNNMEIIQGITEAAAELKAP